MTSQKLQELLNHYAPFKGAGIRVSSFSADLKQLTVEMPLTSENRNYVGTHFGGSLYAMCDPCYMLMLIELLGEQYVVWDKAASIEFIRPGTGLVQAVFQLSDQDLELIYEKTSRGKKYEPEFTVEVLNEKQELVARVHKTLWIKKRRHL